MTSKLEFCFGIAAAILVAAVPPGHAGGGIVTAHPLSITLKTVSQTTNEKGEHRPDPFTAKTGDVFNACVGRPPSKTEGIYLFLNCTSLDLPNEIDAIDTQPLTKRASVGTVSFDTTFKVFADKKGTLKSVSLPVTITIDCTANSVTTTAEFHGTMDLNYTPVGTTTSVCPMSGKVKVTGTAVGAPGNTIVDDGSSITIKNRSASITTLP